MDYSLPGSSVHAILQARVLEWGAIAFSERKLKPLAYTQPYERKLRPREVEQLAQGHTATE